MPAAMDTLAILLPISRATWLVVITSVTTVAFALSAFACDRLGRTITSPFLAAGAWLFGAFAVLVCLAVGLKVARSGWARGLLFRRAAR